MLDHGRIHQGHEKEIRDVSTFIAQHVGAARQSIWRDVTLTLRKNQPSRFKHVIFASCSMLEGARFFLTSALEGGGWSKHAPGRFTGTHCIGGWVGPRAALEGCGKSHPLRDSIHGPSNS